MQTRMPNKISIIIPNWNGRAFLERCIAAVLQSAVEYGQPFECLLVDDASEDGSAADAARNFPQVTLIAKSRNEGFGKAVNDAADAATGDILVLVNNDLIARPAFVSELCAPYETNPDLFGVSGKTITWNDGTPNHVNMRGRYQAGQLMLTWSDDAAPTETMFVQGGSCAFRRDLFLQFGGFHNLFHPGYWEDYDISYQALKAGYKNLYVPAALGAHLGQGSMIRAHGEERIAFVRERNRLLLLALNLTGAAHDDFWDYLPRYVCRAEEPRFKHRASILRFLWTNRRTIQTERQRRSTYFTVTDADIFNKFSDLGTLC